MIFSNSYARNMTLIAPVDTGMWQHICYENNSAPWFSKNFTCSAWPKPYTLGTLQAFDHVILANAIMWQDQLGQGSAKIALAKVFSRMFGQWGKYPVNSSNILTYWESDFQGAVLYPQGVRMVVGSFSELFGTHYGKLLRDWCAARGWILAWAMGGVPNTTSLAGHRPPHRLSADDWPSVPYAYNNRLLDPAVFARTNAARNASIPGNASAAFSAVWDAVNASVAQQGASGRQWHEWWAALRAGAPAALSVAPLSARSCADPDRCVGVDAARRCVCYQS